MGVTIAVTRVACATSTGTQDITTSDLGGLTPKAARFFVVHATSDGTPANGAVIGIGAATGSGNQWAVGASSQHNVSTSQAERRGLTDECVVKCWDSGAGIDGEAAFDSFITNGVRINWGNAPGSAYLLVVELYAGTDLDAYAGIFTPVDSEDSSVDVTAPGFEPDLVYACTTGYDFDDTAHANIWLAYGAAVNTSPVVQRCWANFVYDGQSTTDVRAIFSESYACGQVDVPGTWIWAGEIGSFDANGFSCTTREGASGGADDVGYLALAFGGVCDVWCGTVTTPTSTGNDSQTGPGFTPQFVALGLTQLASVGSVVTDGTAGSLGIGAFTADAEYCVSWQDEDGQSTTDTQSLSDDVAANLPQDDGSTGHVAVFVSMDSSGWTLNFTSTIGTAKKWWGVAVGVRIVELAATLAGASATPDDPALIVAREMAGTLAGASATPDTPALIVARDLAATLAGSSVTPDDPALIVAREMAGTLAGSSATPDTPALIVARALAATLAGASATPDDAALALVLTFTAELAGASITPDDSALIVARDLAATLAGASVTPDDLVLIVARTLAATLAGASATPDDAALSLALTFAAELAGASVTPDDPTLIVAREMAAALGGVSVTPDDVALIVAREMAATLAGASATPDDVALIVGLLLAAELAGVSATPDDAALIVARDLAAVLAGASATPDDPVLIVARALAATLAGVSVTPDDVALAIVLAFAAELAGASATPDDVTLIVARDLAAVLAGSSVTPDDPTLIVARVLVATLAGVSVTPDDVALAIVLAFAAELAGASATPDDAGLIVAREMAATLAGASATPDDVSLTVALLLAATLAGASATPDDVVLSILGRLLRVAFTSSQPGVAASVRQPGAAFTSSQPGVTFSTEE